MFLWKNTRDAGSYQVFKEGTLFDPDEIRTIGERFEHHLADSKSNFGPARIHSETLPAEKLRKLRSLHAG